MRGVRVPASADRARLKFERRGLERLNGRELQRIDFVETGVPTNIRLPGASAKVTRARQISDDSRRRRGSFRAHHHPH
jgi:hypothetical protein